MTDNSDHRALTGGLARYRGIRHPARHVASKMVEIVGGALFLSRPGQALWRRHRRASAPPTGIRAAVVAHVYYPDLLDEVLAAWRCCPDGTALHITVPPDRVGELDARLPPDHVFVHTYANRGRDIAPFLSLLASGVLDRYDAALKLHTKRSPHLLTGTHRRRLLFAALAGNPGNVAHVLAHFRDRTVGIVGWGLAHRTHPRHWGRNEAPTRALVARMRTSALESPMTLSYFEGSMFWFRPAALAPISALALAPTDFQAEPMPADGDLAHAVERAFNATARIAGFRVVTLSGRDIAPR